MYDTTNPVEGTNELQQSTKTWGPELNMELNVAYGAAEISLGRSNVAGKPLRE